MSVSGRATAPEVFSLVQNPDASISFLNNLFEIGKIANVYVDLSKVQTIGPEAIATLLAVIHSQKLSTALVSGNTPIEPRAKEMLDESGFYDCVRVASGATPPPALGKIKTRKRSKETMQVRYDQRVANELVEFGATKLHGRTTRHQMSYRVLSEAMLNTMNHASRHADREPWWASVYFDSQRNRACFTFIDQGVGIFGSHCFTRALRIQRSLRALSNAELLCRLLQGQIRSSTKVEGRGNGIPGMYNACKAGRIQNLFLLSNRSSANVDHDRYSDFKNEFSGTIVYWEIGKDHDEEH